MMSTPVMKLSFPRKHSGFLDYLATNLLNGPEKNLALVIRKILEKYTFVTTTLSFITILFFVASHQKKDYSIYLK